MQGQHDYEIYFVPHAFFLELESGTCLCLESLRIDKCSRYDLLFFNQRCQISWCVQAKSPQLCLTLYHPVDSSPPGCSVHGVLQPRILEWVAMPSFRGSSWPRDQTHISYIFCLGRTATWEALLSADVYTEFLISLLSAKDKKNNSRSLIFLTSHEDVLGQTCACTASDWMHTQPAEMHPSRPPRYTRGPLINRPT